jgi:hypothetical protein
MRFTRFPQVARGDERFTIQQRLFFTPEFPGDRQRIVPSTYCSLLLINVSSRQSCGGVDFLKLIDECIVSNEIKRFVCFRRLREAMNTSPFSSDSSSRPVFRAKLRGWNT